MDLWSGRGDRRRALHDGRQLASAVARGELRRRALQLEQAPRVPASSSTCRSGPSSRSSWRSRATSPRTGRCWRSTAGRSATRSTSPPTPTPTATTSPGSRGEFTVAKDQNVRLRTRLVQRPQRHLPRRGPPGDQPGHRLLERVPDRRGAVRLRLRSTRSSRRSRRSTPTTRATAAPPRRSRASTSPRRRAAPAARRCWRGALERPRLSGHRATARRPFPRGPRPRAGLAPADAARPRDARRTSRRARSRRRGCRPLAGLPDGQHRDASPTTTCSSRACAWRRVLACTEYPDFELIVVDNGSHGRHPRVPARAGRSATRTCGSC